MAMHNKDKNSSNRKKFMCCKNRKMSKEPFVDYASTLTFSGQASKISLSKSDRSHSRKSFHSKQTTSPDNTNLTKYQIKIQRFCSEDCPTRKILTAQLVDKLCDKKTVNRLHLSHIVFLKVSHPEAPCPFAIEANSYDMFKDFFHPLIMELQEGNDSNNLYKNLDFGDVTQLQSIDLNENKDVPRVQYADIIIRRNLADYDLVGNLTAEQRISILELLKTKCKEAFANLKSVNIPNEWSERMKSDVPFLTDSMAMLDYPTGRLNMAFVDDSKSVIGGIINFDDHIQLVASTEDGRLGHIYSRMCQTLQSSQFSNVEFRKHKKYGYVTFSPQFIGSGFNIRLFLKLPYVAMMDDVEEAYLSDLGLSLKSCQEPFLGLMIMTNKKTLNVTEIEIFNNIVEGFRRLYDLNKELGNTSPNSINDENMPAEDLTKLIGRINNSTAPRTYTKRYLNETIIHQYKKVLTNFNGIFNHCIRANAFHPNSLFPKASDPDCFSRFGKFLNPIILEANNTRQFMHRNFPVYESTENEERYRLKHSLIKGYRVRFSRNFQDFPFPMMMSSKERCDIESKLVDCFKNFPSDLAGRYIKLKNIKKDHAFDFLHYLNIIPKTSNGVKRSSWIYRNWPQNRGIFLANKDQNHPYNVLTIVVNESDHFQVSCINFVGERLDYCYDRAVTVMKHMDGFFNHAYSKKPFYGFLSSNPQNVGCCMRASAHIFLANLGRNVPALDDFCFLNNMNYRGADGSGTASKDCIFDISFKLNLNYSEIQIIMIFIQRLKDLILEERKYDNTISKPEIGAQIKPVYYKVISEQESHKDESIVENKKERIKRISYLSKELSKLSMSDSSDTMNVVSEMKISTRVDK